MLSDRTRVKTKQGEKEQAVFGGAHIIHGMWRQGDPWGSLTPQTS